jgi:hypothetical protein
MDCPQIDPGHHKPTGEGVAETVPDKVRDLRGGADFLEPSACRMFDSVGPLQTSAYAKVSVNTIV